MKRVPSISKIKKYAKEKMSNEPTGHDWFHVERVFKMASKIAHNEKAGDLYIIQAASLLHDMGDWKINTTDKSETQILQESCKELGIREDIAGKIIAIISNMSFSSNLDRRRTLTLEGKIVQDADRLEALGAIGIARAFAYGGKKNRQLYNPKIKPRKFTTTASYRNAQSTTVNHFYEKLFLLKMNLHTDFAKKIAAKRERFMRDFLSEFYNEWEGKK